MNSRFSRSDPIKDYFEGSHWYWGCFDDPTSSDDKKISYLLGIFDMWDVLLSKTAEEDMQVMEQAKTLRKSWSFGKKSSSRLREIKAAMHEICSSSEEGYFKIRRDSMKARDEYRLPAIEKTVRKTRLMAAFPLNDEFVQKAASFAEEKGFHNFARLLQKRLALKPEEKFVHKEYLERVIRL